LLALRAEGADRLCVLTILGAPLLSSPVVIDALRSQANWLVGRVHGNLVQIYDVGQSGEEVFLVSEYVEGADLGTLLARGGAAPAGIAAFTALELGEALAFLRVHEHEATGVTTRLAGLSPSSVILARDGKVKLLHRGSSLALPAGTLATRGPAVVSLLAPEAIDSAGGPAADVFTVGALLWHMLTGRPLAGDDSAGHLARLLGGTFEPKAPSTATDPGRQIPEALDKLVLSALAPRPQDRPASFEALRSELAAILKALPDADERAVRGFVSETLGADLALQATEVARLQAAALKPLDPSTLK
jgi:serine/threonine-protein kinase